MNGSRSSGHCCVTDLGFLWLYAVRSQTVAAMAVKRNGESVDEVSDRSRFVVK